MGGTWRITPQRETATMNKSLAQQLIWSFYIPSILIAIAYGILSPVLPVYAGTLTSAYALVGIILAAESFGRVIGDIPVSWLIRIFGMKQTMLLGIILAVIPIMLLYWISHVWVIIALLFASGLGHAFYNISRHAYITVTVSTEMRGRAIGLVGGVFRMGKFIGPLTGGWVAEEFGLRAGFLAFTVFSVLTLFFVWRYMPFVEANESEEAASQEAEKNNLLIFEMFRQQMKILLTAGTGQVLGQALRQGWLVLIPLYAANILDLDIGTIGLIVGVGSGMDLLFFYVSGILMDRFGRKWAIVPSFAMQSLGVLLIPLCSGAYALAAVAGFIGFANGLSSGTMMTVGSDFAPPNMRGEFLSAWRLIGDAGMVGAPLVIGAVAQALVLQMSVVAVAGSGFGAVILFAFFVPETLKRKEEN